MIEGLKLTMTGEQLITRLEERIRFHETSTAREESRRARVAALTLIRDHLVAGEVYRLGEYDLRFADLLPEDEWTDCGCLERWHFTDAEEPAVAPAATTPKA